MDKIASTSIVVEEYAPIVLFAFNRPKHTEATLRALQKAKYAEKTELYVFLDGPRNNDDKLKIDETLTEIKKASCFRKVIINQRASNLGLATNIFEGINEVFTKYEKAIILEDDIEVSENFLSFMNVALTYYKQEKKVWHIGGYNESIRNYDETRTFFWRVMRCWGWATWRDRWIHYKKDTQHLINTFSNADIYRFNLNSSEDFWGQVLANHQKKIDTWAIFWYATIFQNGGLCLNPAVSHVRNIGFDSSGVHCGTDSGKHTVKLLNSSSVFYFPSKPVEDTEIVELIMRHYESFKPSLIKRIKSKFLRELQVLFRL
jgi:hypothetical protein